MSQTPEELAENGPETAREAAPAPARPPRSRRFARFCFWALVIVWVVTRVVAEGWWLTTILLYFPQVVYLAVPALAALVGLIGRDWKALGWSAACALFVLWVMMGYNVPLPHWSVGHGRPRVRVLAYNIEGAVQGQDGITAQVGRYQPDVVVFSEALGWKDDDATKVFFAKEFPGWHFLYAQEVFIASRWPFVEEESRPLGPEHVKYQGYPRKAGRVEIDAPFGRFQVLGAHFYTSMHGWTLKKEWRRLPAYLHETTSARQKQARQLLEWSRTLPGPIIMAGDFNTPPDGRIYRELCQTLTDSFKEAGVGWGYTFPNRRPVLRIDYVLHSPHWTAVHSEVGPEFGSDHRPLFCELELNP